MSNAIDKALKERGGEYGDFKAQAKIEANLLAAMEASRNWVILSEDKKSALRMVAVKIARILNGNPENHDNFLDLAGYATLIEKDLRPTNE